MLPYERSVESTIFFSRSLPWSIFLVKQGDILSSSRTKFHNLKFYSNKSIIYFLISLLLSISTLPYERRYG